MTAPPRKRRYLMETCMGCDNDDTPPHTEDCDCSCHDSSRWRLSNAPEADMLARGFALPGEGDSVHGPSVRANLRLAEAHAHLRSRLDMREATQADVDAVTGAARDALREQAALVAKVGTVMEPKDCG